MAEEIPENVEFVPMFWGKVPSDINIAYVKKLMMRARRSSTF
jgi:hypothetical protein